jgi:hypothetical protein
VFSVFKTGCTVLPQWNNKVFGGGERRCRVREEGHDEEDRGERFYSTKQNIVFHMVKLSKMNIGM